VPDGAPGSRASSIWRAASPAGAAARAVGKGAWLPLGLGLGIAALAMQQSRPPAGAGAEAMQPLLLWLHAPLALLAAHAVVATIEAWPLLGRARAGASALRRLCPSALAGCGIALAGGTLAAAGTLALAGALFAALLAALNLAVPPPRAFARAAPSARPAIDAEQPHLQFSTAELAPIDAVRINPQVAVRADGGFEPVVLQLTVDGEEIAARLVVRGNGEQILVPLPTPRPVRVVAVARTSAPTLSLLWPPGSLELRHAEVHWLSTNLARAALSYAVPIWFALLAAAALRRQLSLPAMLTFALATLGVLLLLGLTPQAAALTACARGRLAANSFQDWLPSLGAGGALLLLLARAGQRRTGRSG
jgi:hypothetical protein